MTSAFDFLLGVLSRQEFFGRYYGNEPVLLKGERAKFKAVFNLDELNRILNFTPLTYPRIRVTDHGNTIHKYDLIEDRDRYANNVNNDIDAARMVRAIAKGGTLVIDRIHQFVPTLEHFVDRLSGELGIFVSANGYYSRRRQLGVNAHFDQHDVIAIQVHGRKRWFFRKDTHTLSQPMRRQQTPVIDAARSGWTSVLVEAGDAFYCPRGVWHFTETGDQNSAHVAVGLYPETLGDWLARQGHGRMMAELLAQYVQNPSAPGAPALSLLLKQYTDLLHNLVAEAPTQAAPPRPHIELD